MNLKFEPLSKERLSEALALIGTVFPNDLKHVTEAYKVSLENDKTHEWWKTRNILEYWVVIDTDSNKIVALTGFYQRKEHSEDEIWLGWYCVDLSARGKGFGRKTLEWTIDEARRRGYKTFRLWTTTNQDEVIAQKLYDSLGLRIYKEEPDEKGGDTTLYRELKL